MTGLSKIGRSSGRPGQRMPCFLEKTAELLKNHEAASEEIRTEAKPPEKRLVAERDGSLFCYHGVPFSIRRNGCADEKRGSRHVVRLPKLRLLFEEVCKAATSAPATVSIKDPEQDCRIGESVRGGSVEAASPAGFVRQERTALCGYQSTKKYWRNAKS